VKVVGLFFLVALSTGICIGQNTIEGTYQGLEKICWGTTKDGKCDNDDNEKTGWKWYHLNWLKIKGDSCFLDQNPVTIYKKDTSWSASDGGFLYYSGTVTRTDTTVIFNLTELFCDYCGELVQKQPDGSYKRVKRIKQYTGRLSGGGFIINDFFYQKIANRLDMISEHPEPYMRDEVFAKPPKFIYPKRKKPRSKKAKKKI
jgi:hypothetical protein